MKLPVKIETCSLGGPPIIRDADGKEVTLDYLNAVLRSTERFKVRDQDGQIVSQGAFNAALARLSSSVEREDELRRQFNEAQEKADKLFSQALAFLRRYYSLATRKNKIMFFLLLEALSNEVADFLVQFPPCQECGAKTEKEAEEACICAGDKDHCHGCELWKD